MSSTAQKECRVLKAFPVWRWSICSLWACNTAVVSGSTVHTKLSYFAGVSSDPSAVTTAWATRGSEPSPSIGSATCFASVVTSDSTQLKQLKQLPGRSPRGQTHLCLPLPTQVTKLRANHSTVFWRKYFIQLHTVTGDEGSWTLVSKSQRGGTAVSSPSLWESHDSAWSVQGLWVYLSLELRKLG